MKDLPQCLAHIITHKTGSSLLLIVSWACIGGQRGLRWHLFMARLRPKDKVKGPRSGPQPLRCPACSCQPLGPTSKDIWTNIFITYMKETPLCPEISASEPGLSVVSPDGLEQGHLTFSLSVILSTFCLLAADIYSGNYCMQSTMPGITGDAETREMQPRPSRRV